MSKNLQNIAVVSISTVGSRILGLARDIMIFAALGAGIWSSAFILAFTIPNLFRRLLGEGALTSAVVPVFSDVLKERGKAGAFSFLNSVLLRLFLFLVLLTALLVGVLLAADGMNQLPDRWGVASGFTAALLPYMILICLAAIIAAALNLLGRFFSAACTPILLNVAMIGSLVLGMFFGNEGSQLVWWLCGGVIFGGFLQLWVPALDLWVQGWRPKPEGVDSRLMRELWRLFLPGLMGAAILQVNILVSRLLAYSLDESAASILYLASRLMELPLGVFTVAVVTVFFPIMARAFVARDEVEYSDALLSGMRLVLAISFPAGLGLFLLGQPILSALFVWGAFDAVDVLATAPLVAIYGLGLPFYSVATLATRGLHAGKEMQAPVRIAGLCLLTNALLGVILMQFWGVGGLAIANVISAIAQSILLWRAVSKSHPSFQVEKLKKSLIQIFVACFVMGLLCTVLNQLILLLGLPGRAQAFAVIGTVIPVAVLAYFWLLSLLKFEEMKSVRSIIARFI